MNGATLQKIPSWATTFLVGLTGFLLVMATEDMKRDVRDIKAKTDTLVPAVAVNQANIAVHEAQLREIREYMRVMAAKSDK